MSYKDTNFNSLLWKYLKYVCTHKFDWIVFVYISKRHLNLLHFGKYNGRNYAPAHKKIIPCVKTTCFYVVLCFLVQKHKQACLFNFPTAYGQSYLLITKSFWYGKISNLLYPHTWRRHLLTVYFSRTMEFPKITYQYCEIHANPVFFSFRIATPDYYTSYINDLTARLSQSTNLLSCLLATMHIFSEHCMAR